MLVRYQLYHETLFPETANNLLIFVKVPSSLKMADMVGASVEVNGGKVYDPLGTLNLHAVAPSAFPHAKWLRESELKHSRAAMLATVGVFASQSGYLAHTYLKAFIFTSFFSVVLGLTIPGYTAVADPVENLNSFVLNQPLAFAQVLICVTVLCS